jgi:hypothetical protein
MSDFKIWSKLDQDEDGQTAIEEWLMFFEQELAERGQSAGTKYMAALIHTLMANLHISWTQADVQKVMKERKWAMLMALANSVFYRIAAPNKAGKWVGPKEKFVQAHGTQLSVGIFENLQTAAEQQVDCDQWHAFCNNIVQSQPEQAEVDTPSSVNRTRKEDDAPPETTKDAPRLVANNLGQEPQKNDEDPEAVTEQEETWEFMVTQAKICFNLIACADGDDTQISKDELIAAHHGDFKLFQKCDADESGQTTLPEWLAFLSTSFAEREKKGAKKASTILPEPLALTMIDGRDSNG